MSNSFIDDETDFSPEQTARIDELDNAAYDFALTLTELTPVGINDGTETLPWDMGIIGDILDACEDILENYGYRVHYPFMDEDEDGNMRAYDYDDERY